MHHAGASVGGPASHHTGGPDFMRVTLPCSSVPQGHGRAPVQWRLEFFPTVLAPPYVLKRAHQVGLRRDKTHIPASHFPQAISLRWMLPSRARAAPLAWTLLKGKPEASYTQPHLPGPRCSVLKQSSGVKKNIYFHSLLATDLGWVSHSLGRCRLPPPLACN